MANTTAQKILPQPNKKYRLITRSDMDGLVCAVLLTELSIIDNVTFAHPKDMQDGLIEVGPDDITTNLPYVESAYLAFDHHASEVTRNAHAPANHIIFPDAPSAARVVYDYFGGAAAFPNLTAGIMEGVDKADAAQFTKEDILDPKGWELLSFIMDSRTGLGRFQDFTISNYQLMMKLIEHCRNHETIDEILQLPDVKERVDLYFNHHIKAKAQIERCARMEERLVIIDFRKEETIWAANRFIVYALFPKANISLHVLWGKNKQNTVFAIGKSILNRTANIDVGALCLSYGGGGHKAAGTCQVENLVADKKLQDIIAKINKDV